MKLYAYLLTLIVPLISITIEQSPITHPVFNKVVLWGHKLHSHTHSYIHLGFQRAFEHLGYKTYWFDDNDNVRGFDFSNSLFITEGQVDNKIPLRKDCRYILHYVRNPDKYRELDKLGNCIYLIPYRFDDSGQDRIYRMTAPGNIKIDSWTYIDIPGKVIYQPWATDLLPEEINHIKEQLKLVKRKPVVHLVASIDGGGSRNPCENESKHLPFKQACENNGIKWYNHKSISLEDNIRLTQLSFMSPAIQSQHQCDNGYIPCRIFKNISYGQWGATNSEHVWQLFKEHNIDIVYNADTYQLFFDIRNKVQTSDINELYAQMDFVRDNHTYLNRVERLLWFMNLIKPLEKLS